MGRRFLFRKAERMGEAWGGGDAVRNVGRGCYEGSARGFCVWYYVVRAIRRIGATLRPLRLLEAHLL